MVDNLIVLDLNDGKADTSIAHLPAPERWHGRGGPRVRFDDYEFAPATWSSICGINGPIYNHAGILEQTPICVDCRITQIIWSAHA